jgi:cyanate permease
MVCCRLVIGLGAGAAIVAASQAARKGAYAAFGQGLFGGAMQVGAGLGLFATPTLQGLFGWRGALTFWGAFGLGAGALCLLLLSGEPRPSANTAPRRIAEAFRSRSLWTLGLVHLGTLGLGQAIAPWLAIYFALSYGFPLDLAAMLGAVGLLAGMFFRPLGGLLLSRRVFTHGALMLAGTAFACVGVVLLALPLHAPLVTGWGLALFACGTTLPYAAVFDEAGRIGAESTLGSGTAQGVVSVLSAPASAFGPPLIGALLGQHGNFSLSFTALVPVGVAALLAALVAGSLLNHRRDVADLRRLRERDGDAYLAQALTRRTRVTRHASRLPAIVTLGLYAQDRGSAIIRRLQHAGGLPLVLPASPAPTTGEAAGMLADEACFREIFDRCLWPLFCQLLHGQTRGLCLIEGSQHVKDTNGTRSTEPLDFVPRAASDAWSAMLQRYLSLLAWLVGMPVLGASWELDSLELTSRRQERAGPTPQRIWPLPAKHAASSGDAQEPAISAQFVTACSAYPPPSPEDLVPFRDDIYGWLRRRDRAFVRQLYQFQVASGQERTWTPAVIAPAESRQPRKQEAIAKTEHIQRVKAR